jgi:hypothetical protein
MFGRMTPEEQEAFDAQRAKHKIATDKYQLERDVKRPHSTTESRYVSRAYNIWDKKKFGGIRHYFWWVVHNTVVHPMLGIAPCQLTFKMHDWASRKLNGK